MEVRKTGRQLLSQVSLCAGEDHDIYILCSQKSAHRDPRWENEDLHANGYALRCPEPRDALCNQD